MLLLGARGARAPLSASVSSTVPGSASPKAGSICSTSKGGDVPSPSPPFFFKTLFFFGRHSSYFSDLEATGKKSSSERAI